jgi:peptidoglycan/LPS O-acetylase OafA/YrhL
MAISVGATTPRLPGLDVIRGIAIALVLVRHSWPAVFAGAGIVGVVMFFTLSGYLITSLLQRELATTGRVSFSRFALMRAIRLVPALALMLVVFAIVESVFNPLGDRSTVALTIAAALLYLRDFPLPFATSPAINTLWTLAVEEQFYLFWPAILVFATRRRVVGKTIVIALAGLIVASSVSVGVFAYDPATVYILPTTWASSLVVGAAAAVYRDRVVALLRAASRFRMPMMVAVAVLLAALSLYPSAKNTVWIYVVGGPTIAILTVVLIFVLGEWKSLPWRALEPVRLLGLVSYAVYIWNAIVLEWCVPMGPLSGIASIAITLLFGVVSWFTVERAARWLRRRIVASANGVWPRKVRTR